MKLPSTLSSHSPEETEAAGRALAEALLADPSLPPFVALYGDLGVGKTAFVRGFASAVCPTARIKSPTFALVNEHPGGLRPLFHFDMYRIESEDDLESIGFYDYWDRKGICLVEWSEHIPYALPERYLRVEIRKNDPRDPAARSLSLELAGDGNKGDPT